MIIEYTEQTRGDYCAEISLNTVSACITGGSIYAYGSSKQIARLNLLDTLRDVANKLEDFANKG